MPAPVDFWFDFSSPYAYLASTWIDALAARHGREVRWRAILLGVTFRAAELRPPVTHPIKREYMLRDFARSARFEGAPFTPPATFPVATQTAARVFWWLSDTVGPEAAGAFAKAGLRAYFAESVPIDDPAAVSALLARLGHDGDAGLAAASDPLWKDRLRTENEAAVSAGIFGAPTIVVDGEPFWGNDRKPQLERWLATGGF